MPKAIVDVAINVLGKPAQTALALFSLLRHSGGHIGTIYFIEEPGPLNSNYSQAELLAALGGRVRRFRPEATNWRYAVDPARLADPAYRHMLRYQYAFEATDKPYLLLIHNDCEFVGDAVGLLLENIGEATGAGEIGQCWLCPAAMRGLCGPGRYLEYRPDYPELEALYASIDPAVYRRKYTEAPTEELKRRPWPLPECRVNEFCCLIDMGKARPATCPQGPARPFGAYVDVGDPYTGNGILDIGVAWFGDLVHMGHAFRHVELKECVLHEGVGHKALFDEERYVACEERAVDILTEKFTR
ncbi:hypothetical protein [Fundidesulfovibrio agrisoli]|uniref:hypothetical protein n=1 Tax=Fundidesulfovibrio agrisoli TaxID=2922717 RepID=UPI001FAE0DA5|nr:hypothetical protein [Fundidesulfovibrio agrisoli]